MQYTQLLTAGKKSKPYSATLGRMLRVLSAIVVVALIGWQLTIYQTDLSHIVNIWSGLSFAAYWWVWLVCTGLMLVNWSAEAFKWQYLSGKVVPLSFPVAFRSIMAGLSLHAVLPHSVGEYAGRIGVISHKQKLKLIGALWVSHTTQMTVTCLAGAFGLAVYLNHYFAFLPVWALTAGGILLTLVVLVTIISFIPRLIRWTERWKLGKFLAAAHRFTFADWSYATGLSLIRYICFSSQFILLLYLLKIDTPLYIQVAGVTWVFLIKSVAPALNIIADLGIREVAALAFFPLFGADPAIVLAASISVWFLNLFVPSLLGSLSFIRLPTCRFF
ncbi:MAG: lysylphosphatidylglycerol synthase transmembrane domain-containing protein [Cyclobacteriaceae bacterium]